MTKEQKKTREKPAEEKRVRRSKLNKLEPVEVKKAGRVEHMSVEDVLRASDEKYRPLFDNMLDGFAYCRIILDEKKRPTDFIHIDVNNAFERLTGLKKEDVVGKRVTEAIPGIKEAHPELFDIYGQVALIGKETEFEIFFKPLKIWLSISVYSPAKSYFVTIFENITEQKQAEEEIAKLARFPSEDPYPVLRIAKDGTILYSNQASSPILKQWCCKQGEQVSYDWIDLVNEVLSNQKPQETELECDGKVFSLTFAPVSDPDFVNVYGLDITKRKQAEEEREVMIKLLSLINSSNHMHELMRLVTVFLRDWSDCEAVGVRLVEGEDFPYYVTSGFSDEFVQAENSLCSVNETGELVRDSQGRVFLECMCGNVISGRYDPSKPFFTRGGSFWTNSTTDLLAGTTEADRLARTRNRCNTAGYESLALVPLRTGGETVGLLQFNSRQRGRFTPERISLFERLADNLAIGLAQRRAEQALRETTQTLEAVIQGSPLSIVAMDRERIVKTWNPAAERTFGWSAEEVIGRPYRAIPKEKMDEADTLFLCALESGLTEVETLRQRKDGSLIDVSISDAPLRDSSGNINGVMAVITDITERKRAEETLKKAENEKATILNTMSELVAYQDAEHRVIWANRAAVESAGFTNEELLGRYCYEVWQGRNKPCVNCPIEKVWKTGRLETEEIHSSDGRVWSVRANPVKNKAGNVIGVVEITLDITERKRAEEALRESEIRFRDLFESMGSGVAVYEAVDDGADFVFRNMNKAGERIDKIRREELIGKSVTEVFPGVKEFGLFEVFQRVWRTGQPEHHPVSLYKDERLAHWVENYVYKVPSGEIVVVYDDVTERKQVEEKLREYQHQLKSMAWQLSKAHEQERRNLAVEMHDRISQRLAMAKVNVQIAAQSSADAEISGKLRSTAEEIGQVIEDAYSLMLELSNPVLYEIGLKAAIETLLKDRIRPEHKIEYELEMDDGDFKLDDVISVPVYQAVRELLTNVVKHSKANKVVVSIHRVGGKVQVVVRDNGIGFDTSRIGAPTAGKEGGFGLFGIRENLEYINGKLEVKSRQGKGTVAIVTAPLEYKAEPDLGGK